MRRDRARLVVARRALLTLAVIAGLPALADEEFLIEVRDPLVRIRAELDVFVNGAQEGTALVVLERGDALVVPADLERAGLAVRGGTRVTLDDRELVSLRSLAPVVKFEVDERALALRITTAPEMLGRHLLDLRPRLRPEGLEQRFDPSAFVDYAADSDLAGHVGLAFEAGGRVGRWLGTTGVSRGYDGGWTRGLTAAVRDDVDRLERLTIGDALGASGPLGGSALLGGVAFGREFSLDPYLVVAPYPSTTALVTSPSTLEVYVNGAMVRQQAVGPGAWELANLPAASGQMLVHAVVRDAFGRERTIDSPFYFSTGLLAPGLSDFGLSAGFRREALGTDSFRYGAPAALGRYRFGWSDRLTPGVRAEASSDVVSGGGSLTVGSPFGELEGDAAASGAHGEPGAAGQVSWLWVSPRTSAAVRVVAQSARYANLALEPLVDRALLDALATGGATLGRGLTVGVEVRAGRFRDLGAFASAGLRASVQLFAGASLTLTGDVGKAAAGPAGLQTFALLAWGRAGYGADASVTRDRDGRTTRAASASKSLPRETGWGFRVHGSGDDRATTFDGILQGQTSFGHAELQTSRGDLGTTNHARVAGGLVYIDGRPYLSRATDGSFALVRAGGLPGIGVTAENSPVGRTARDGTLLVTDLQPYYASRLAIHDRDVPLEFEPGHTVRFIAPPLRGGAIVAFDLRRISAVAGQLTVLPRGRDERLANGEVTAIVDGELRTSPVTETGRFFLERMPPGKHVLQAVWRGGSCRAVVTLPESAPPVFDAGELRCIPDALDPTGRIPSLRDPGYANPPLPDPQETGAGSGGR